MLHLGEVDLRGLLAQDEVDFASANSLLVFVEMVEGHFIEKDGLNWPPVHFLPQTSHLTTQNR